MSMKCYPSCMVPRVGLKHDVKVEELLKLGDVAFARRVDRSLSQKDVRRMADGTCIVPADSDLREDTFKRIPFLSVTMLRRAFPLEYAKYDLKMKSPDDDWKGGFVWPWKNKRRATRVVNSYLMVYKASLLHNQPAKYQRRFDSREEAELLKDDYDGLAEALIHNEFTKKSYYHSLGTISLMHSPTLLNYWHYELKLENREGKVIKKVEYKDGQDPEEMNMNASFVNYVWDHFLCKLFWVDENPCIPDIPLSFFCDNKIGKFRRVVAAWINKCLFAFVPIVAR